MALQVVDLTTTHLEPAVALVCERYRSLRGAVPLLPPQYGERDTLYPMLQQVLQAGSGMVAVRDSQIAGFLAGFDIGEFQGGPAAYSPEWANGALADESARIYEALYTRLANKWVADGRTVHLISLFAHDRQARDTLHWLGFGGVVTDAIRGLETVTEPTTDLEIRRATSEDAKSLPRLEQALAEHLRGSPIYLLDASPRSPEACAALLEDTDYAVWLALMNDKPLAFLLTGPASDDASTIIQDQGTTSITGAYTVPEARGMGIATTLLRRALAWAREAGYRRCAVDFETTNPLARRFWLRHFTPVTYSLGRQIDRRAAPELESQAERG